MRSISGASGVPCGIAPAVQFNGCGILDERLPLDFDEVEDFARERWPVLDIQGDGPFVAVPLGQGTVCSLWTVIERSTHAPPNSQFVTQSPPARMPSLGLS